MARYIDADKIDYTVTIVGEAENAGYRAVAFESDIDEMPTADVVEVVRCKDCKFNVANKEKDPLDITDCSGDDIVRSYFLTDGLDPNDYCSRGTRTPKERGADKPKVTCLNCKHLMFSDMYGECNKQLRIVNPSDTCEYAEPKERGGEN